MAASKQVRRSVTPQQRIDTQIELIARSRPSGLEAQKQKEKIFFELAKRFHDSADPEEVNELGDALGRLVLGG